MAPAPAGVVFPAGVASIKACLAPAPPAGSAAAAGGGGQRAKGE